MRHSSPGTSKELQAYSRRKQRTIAFRPPSCRMTDDRGTKTDLLDRRRRRVEANGRGFPGGS
jgi:hypothetical protein